MAEDKENKNSGATTQDQDEETQGSSRPVTRMRPKNPKELFLEAIPYRAKESAATLRTHLTGKIGFSIQDTNEKFCIDWSSAECQVKANHPETLDCHVSLSSGDLMRIASGDLNAQIAMLSTRVLIQGKADYAVYVFNLIAPYNY